MTTESIKSPREEARQEGLAHLRTNDPEAALVAFDRALELGAGDETFSELVCINKSFALISLGRPGPEIQLLPRIVLRRADLRHVLLAAYNLQFKYRQEQNYERSRFYGRVALEAAIESGDSTWMPEILLQLGNDCVFDSRTDEAIRHYEEVLDRIAGDPSKDFTRAFATQNLGYCSLLAGRLEQGIVLLHEAIELMKRAGAEAFLAEPWLDLCLGYLELGDFESARRYGEMGLDAATEQRQIRNGYYLLGEVAFKTGDTPSAEFYFGKLATLYPDFPHLKNLLLAIDLRGMVNWKLS